MSDLAWIFDPTPPSGAVQGGNASLHVFNPTLQSFVREVLQNSRDQSTGGPVRVVFTFEQLSGAAKARFLEAIGWTTLQPHMQGAAQFENAQVSHILEDGLEMMESDTITILRIDDMGTRGLEGGEDDLNGNFNALCRNTLVSNDNPLRGGSYGLGKAVLWRFSSVMTVLFASRIAGNPRQGLRLFGRAELPYHVVGNQRFSGAGYFGRPEQVSGGSRAASVWDEEAEPVIREARLFRDPELGSGTSILVVGFREPQAEEAHPVESVARNVAEDAAHWFWPAIQKGQLEVQVVARRNGQTVLEHEVHITPEVSPFAQAVSETVLNTAPIRVGEVAEVEIPILVPGRKHGGGGEPVDATVRLRVRRAEGNGGRIGLTNQVALTRGAGMVVKYKPIRTSVGDRVFHAVLLAGRANGASVEDVAVEAFLRAAEPPSHEEWTATPRVRSEYKPGYTKALQELTATIDREVAKLFEEPTPDQTPGPALLAKMFQVSEGDGAPAGNTGKYRVKDLSASFNGQVWEFSGKVTRTGVEEKPWHIAVGLRLAGETGPGEPVTIDTFQASIGVVHGKGAERVVKLPATCSELSFSGTSILLSDQVEQELVQRTRLDLDVRAAGGAA